MEPKFSVGERVNVMNTAEPYVFEAINYRINYMKMPYVMYKKPIILL